MVLYAVETDVLTKIGVAIQPTMASEFCEVLLGGVQKKLPSSRHEVEVISNR